MRFVAFIALLVCLCMVLCSCSVSLPSSQAAPSSSAVSSSADSSAPGESEKIDRLKIGYSKTNGFNPYLINDELVFHISGLISEKLVELNPEMGLDYRIASSIAVNGLTAIVEVRQDAVFADGTPVTPQDVAASFNAARNSQMFGASFAHITDVQVQDSTVVVTLSRPDSLFAYLCTIPVLKQEDIASPQPTLSGRYTYASDSTLIKNPHSTQNTSNPFETIELVDISNFDALVSGLSVGSIDLYSTTRESVTSSAYTSRSTSFNTNHLVFLGVNSESGFLSQPAARTAVSNAIDREVLCERAYYNAALPARGAIHPLYSCVTGKQSISTISNLAECQTQMETLDYTRSGSDGYYTDKTGKKAELRILVNSGSALKRSAATLLKEQLNEAGFAVVLEETDDFSGVYLDKIAKRDFDLYIGELKLYNNMDISPFWAGGAAGAGVSFSPELLAAYTAFTENSDTAESFETLFAQQLPWIPLCWRSGTLVINKHITGIVPSYSNIFYSIQAGLPNR